MYRKKHRNKFFFLEKDVIRKIYEKVEKRQKNISRGAFVYKRCRIDIYNQSAAGRGRYFLLHCQYVKVFSD